MNVTDIAFPNLGIYLEDVPKSFSIFGFQIAFYGLIIGIGVLLGLLMAVHDAKVTGQNPDVYWDFAIYAIIFSIIGARLYYVAFSWDNYKDNLLSIFNTRNGGMAIYGGVIAAFITLFVYCRIKRLNPFQIGDSGVLGLILGQAIGRWGNFMNREAFGGYTDNLLAMRLPIDAVRSQDISQGIAEHIAEGTNYIQVHPTFLYESMWNVLVLVLLLAYRRRKRFHGEICLMYLGGYGLGRFFIEGLRTDQLLIPGLGIAVSQALSLILVIFAVTADVAVRMLIQKGRVRAYTPCTAATAVKIISEASDAGTAGQTNAKEISGQETAGKTGEEESSRQETAGKMGEEESSGQETVRKTEESAGRKAAVQEDSE